MKKAIERMSDLCIEYRHKIATPEHLLVAMMQYPSFQKVLDYYCSDLSSFMDELNAYLAEQERFDENDEADELQCVFSYQLMQLIQTAVAWGEAAQVSHVKATHIVYSMYELEDSLVAALLEHFISDKVDFLSALIATDEDSVAAESLEGASVLGGVSAAVSERLQEVDGLLEKLHPMVGRVSEMERMVQILCRKDAHNVLLVGEIGVGKRTLTYELAKRMKGGLLPERFSEGRFYRLNTKSLMQGVMARTDLDRRLSDVLQTVAGNKMNIIFVDQLQSFTSSFSAPGSMDDSDVVSLLKPYLDFDNYRFVCTCPPNDYAKKFADQRTFSNYFQKIDVEQPSEEDAVQILHSLLPDYEAYHQVRYSAEAVRYAVTATSKHIHHQYLPQKAIALLDDAGAYVVSHQSGSEAKTVDVPLLAKLLSEVCKNDSLMMDEESDERLFSLESRILSKIYGQDEAVRRIVENVQMSKAGLLEDGKPLASFLFVGPTGVGKTEVANVLAKELGVELVRFDMSEYVEQYSVSKLIGSPAGYVGYDDGGLLTAAVRRNPNCVLLLDEIEKAHDSIFNILLQVMDYARLTDNKGNQADFRNVIVIMTSNAGAQFASYASVGFGGVASPGEVMLKQVKKSFKPEFLNRLTATVLFRSMDEAMAARVLEKKLSLLSEKLTARNVTMTMTEAARGFLMEQGYSKTYGAREMDRVITSHLKPLLTKEILFGRLKNGGSVSVDFQNDKLVLL